MKVELVRSGGLAGVVMRASMDTDELPPAIAAQVETALEVLDWDAAPTPALWADGYQYELTVSRARERRSKTLQEHELPDDARPLLDALLSRGRLE